MDFGYMHAGAHVIVIVNLVALFAVLVMDFDFRARTSSEAAPKAQSVLNPLNRGFIR